jgi:hypothetical protein
MVSPGWTTTEESSLSITEETKPGPVSEQEKRRRTLLLLLDKRQVVGRIRTRIEPALPEGVDRYVVARPPLRSEFPHGQRTFTTLLDLAADELIDHQQRRLNGSVESIEDVFTFRTEALTELA